MALGMLKTKAKSSTRMPGHKSKPIRILMVSEQALVRAGLRQLIENQADFKVVGEASGRLDALMLAGRVRPDIVLIDIDTQNGNGVHLLRDLFIPAQAARLMILASARNMEAYQEAMTRGAMGLVLKEQPPETLFEAIEKVHAGQAWLDPPTMAEVLTRIAHEIAVNGRGREAYRIKLLTAREREIVNLVAAGRKNRSIAATLFISEATVRHHLSSVFSKLGVVDRYELIIYAFRHGLVEVPRQDWPASDAGA